MSQPAVNRIQTAFEQGRLTISRLEDGSGVVLDVDREQLLSMNDTALTIVEAIAAGRVSLHGLAEMLQRRFDCSSERAECDVLEFVKRLDAAL